MGVSLVILGALVIAAGAVTIYGLYRLKHPARETKRTGYMCAVDLEYHVGADISPSMVYSSPELAIEGLRCAKSCGVVEVEITLKRYVIESQYL